MYYSQYAFIITRNRGDDATSIRELRYYGTPAPSSLEDGHLTLGKALTLPRVSGHAAGAETPRAASLVVHYDTTVDSVVSGSTVVDISGNGLNGTLEGGAVYSSTDRALTFDGVDDIIITSNISPSITGQFVHSFSVWLNFTALEGSYDYPIFIGSIGTLNQTSILRTSTGSIGPSFGSGYNIFTSFVPNTNQWYHMVVVYRGGVVNGTNVDYYIDGVKKTTTGGSTGTLNIDENTLSLGDNPPGAGNPFKGSISNFKLWNVALTVEEVAAEYALGRTGKSINLTDTALCLGGTVPRAQLDVRGSALVEGNLTIEGGGITRSGNGTIPIMGRVSNAFVTTSSSSPDILISGLLENVNINRLRTAAYSATVVMTGANISAAGSRALGEFLSFGEVSGSDTHTELAYGFYDGQYTKVAILKFSIGSDNRSITVYQTGARYYEGQALKYTDTIWTITLNGSSSYGVKDLTILY